MSRFLFGAVTPDGRPARRAAPGRLVELVTAALLPERLRRQYGLAWGLRERVAFAAAMAVMRPGYALLPARARWLPAYQDAERRVRGLPPSGVNRWMDARLTMLASLATSGSG
ncbi:MAG: DUF2236 domain-containing protein [Kofleriaceae bacterium]|nr:DUF2236 domain-containing protein [Kofleriaceae bacterium]